MKRSLLLGLVLLAACRPADDTHEGIAVGNPGLVSMALATSSGFTLTRAELPIDWVGYASCSGSDRLASLDRTDLVVPATAAIPQGSWCGFVVALSGAATLEADWSEGGASGTLQATFTLSDVELQAVETIEVIDSTTLAIELASPDWLDPAALGLADGVDRVITGDDPEADLLRAALGDESAVFDDPDGSGLVESEERSVGAIALPGDVQFSEAVAGVSSDAEGAAGCSCSSSEANPPTLLLWLLLSLLGYRGRRHTDGGAPATSAKTRENVGSEE